MQESKYEIRNLKIEIQNTKPENRNLKPEIRNLKPEFRISNFEFRISFFYFLLFTFYFSSPAFSQDTTIITDNRTVTLPEVYVQSGLDYEALLTRIQNDTSFYKAFRNLHVVQFSAYNSIRMLDKKGNVKATYNGKSKQLRQNGCRWNEFSNVQTTGDFFDADSNFNYMTAEMYAGLFFSKGKVCGENNIVAGRTFNPGNKKGMEKHKEQLKMLFFNPGRKVPGIPFIGDKLDLYDDHAKKVYNYTLDYEDYRGKSAYVFTIKPKENLGLFRRDDIVVDEMVTWFDAKTMNVIARKYSMSYKAGVYDFDVNMEVEMTTVGNLVVPQTLRYKGNFSALGKKRERGEFTATLFDFKL